jgi:exodeoxyribonuclease V alpha subunit
MPVPRELHEVVVEVTGVRYRSPEGDFAVLDTVSDEGDEVVVTGAVGHVHEGESLTVAGEWRDHARHGRQLHAVRAALREPTSERALVGYLSSIKHVGPRGAAYLVAHHGAAVLEIVDRAPRARLLEVPGIGRARVPAAVRSWERQSAQRAVRLFLSEHGVEAAVAARIHRALGDRSLELLRADPFAITELDGVGFATADALARALGVQPDAPQRLEAGLCHTLAEAELEGHCHLPHAELVGRAGRLLSAAAPPGDEPTAAALEARIDALAARGRLVVDAGAPGEESGDGAALVADAGMYGVERRLADHVSALLDAEPCLELKRVERPRSGDFVPSDDQWRGVTGVVDHRLSILTGGPGTGKSSAMRSLVDLLRANRRRVRLCAPTGKAARRLAAATGAEATTIHRLLEWIPGEGFARGPEHPIGGADVLIVDEASMLGVRLAEALLGAVGPRTHVLLVGDVDQLAPVGPGRVLEDLIASGRVPTTALSEVFRQAARSLIVRAAHAINHGQRPRMPADGDVVRDFFFLKRDDPSSAFAEIVSLACHRLPEHYGLDARMDVQVLAPMHRGPLGIDALNAELRARLNPDGAALPGTSLRVGDRVIQTRNDHEHELMNGEIGLLLHHDAERERVLLGTDDGRRLALPLGALDTLRLGHAISIHKAQGSQAPAVVVALARAHSIMLTRNLLYTAVTRAERVCVLVGEPAALDIALGRRDARRRHTRLAALVGPAGGRSGPVDRAEAG